MTTHTGQDQPGDEQLDDEFAPYFSDEWAAWRMARFLPFGTIDRDVPQMGELADALKGHITGARLIVESTADGHRYEVRGIRWEPTVGYPEGRLILVTSDCVHWSEICDPKVVAANEAVDEL
jgi:hypothetical protein